MQNNEKPALYANPKLALQATQKLGNADFIVFARFAREAAVTY